MRVVLVTGGTGSFGQAFIRHLLDKEERRPFFARLWKRTVGKP